MSVHIQISRLFTEFSLRRLLFENRWTELHIKN